MNDPPLACKLAIEELIKGQASANRLNALLLEISPCASSYRSLASELMAEILSSFSRSLFVLDAGEGSEVCQSLADAPSLGRKRKPKRAKGAGANSRRRTNSHSTKRITSCKLEDGFPWRKYGQKAIYNSNHPRSYYRCTHKYDRGCQAIKQVQRSEQDDSLFLITYIGDHTCRNNDNFAVAVSDGTPPLISFGAGGGGGFAAAASDKLDSSFSSLVQEAEEEVLSNLTAGSSLSGLFAPAPVNAGMEFIVDPLGFDFNGVFSFDDDDENL